MLKYISSFNILDTVPISGIISYDFSSANMLGSCNQCIGFVFIIYTIDAKSMT